MNKLALSALLFNLTLWSFAQQPEPNSPAWIDSPDAPRHSHFEPVKSTLISGQIRDAITLQPIFPGEVRLDTTLYMPVFTDGSFEFELPFNNSDKDSLYITAPGYNKYAITIEQWLRKIFYDTFLLQPISIQNYTVDNPTPISFKKVDSTSFSANIYGVFREEDSSRGAKMEVAGEVFAPKGLLSVDMNSPWSWQFRIDHCKPQGWLDSSLSYVMMSSLNAWHGNCLLNPQCQTMATKVIGIELFGTDTLTKVAYTHGLQHGVVWLTAEGFPLIQRDTLIQQEMTQTIFMQYTKNTNYYPLFFMYKLSCGSYKMRGRLHFAITQSPAFRGRIQTLPKRLNEVPYDKEYWPNIDYFWGEPERK